MTDDTRAALEACAAWLREAAADEPDDSWKAWETAIRKALTELPTEGEE